ncbi:hypothetical protein ACFE04_011152 [Oxalis oulophora]
MSRCLYFKSEKFGKSSKKFLVSNFVKQFLQRIVRISDKLYPLTENEGSFLDLFYFPSRPFFIHEIALEIRRLGSSFFIYVNGTSRKKMTKNEGTLNSNQQSNSFSFQKLLMRKFCESTRNNFKHRA